MTAAAAADALDRAAQAGIHCLPIPTPFAVGRVNTYLIEDRPLTLVDSGPNSGKALDALERALHARGHAIEDLGLILVTVTRPLEGDPPAGDHPRADDLSELASRDPPVAGAARPLGPRRAHHRPRRAHRGALRDAQAPRREDLRPDPGAPPHRLRDRPGAGGQRRRHPAYLTLSEVLGHVDLLIRDGRAREVEAGDVVRFDVVA